MLTNLNKKFGILFLSLLALPSCAPWNFRRSNKLIPVQQSYLPKKAYLYIDDIECEDCFNLIQGIILPIKGVCDVSLENEGYNYRTAGSSSNRVVISYNAAIKLNTKQIRMVLEEWNFELQKIEL